MSFRKVDKEFCLTDNAVNVYGYRLLTEGLQLNKFKPAIGFLMHGRDKGVAVRWEDFRTEGDKLFAKPVVNEFKFPELAEEIENGFYAAASVGHIVALEVSDDLADKLEGQTGLTVTKWFPREISIVDIPGNYSALAQLYDESDCLLHDLSDQSNLPNNKKSMDKQQLITAAELKLLNLADDATQAQVSKALSDLATKAATADGFEKELKNLKAAHDTERVEAIVTQGMTDKKLTKELADTLKKDYATNPDGLKALVASMTAQASVTESLKAGDVPEKYAGKTFNDLYLSGELESVKKEFPEYYKTLKEKNDGN